MFLLEKLIVSMAGNVVIAPVISLTLSRLLAAGVVVIEIAADMCHQLPLLPVSALCESVGETKTSFSLSRLPTCINLLHTQANCSFDLKR